ncbi:MAG: hypothetical protein A2902_06380 [Elusimicrobia bacterium RIFCSPLOWO2_01_FULL_64_13]|nr:MAG: hypothetical protein A2636_06490 [Elusimicrobia bacterium RIFCSPHIGHO2_01_FULL_64_10]OGR98244.1 MAG: hypothetical protein A2902_06380 [Elusimicrobia bacterium RIFCSPLOWO2_01_FULL_64_13]
MKDPENHEIPVISSLIRFTRSVRDLWHGWTRLRRSMRGRLRQVLGHKLTVMIVPHNAIRRVNLQFTFSFAFFLTLFSIGLFSWASLTVMSNMDYWGMRTDHEIMKLKVEYFANEIRKSREIIDRVREADTQLREMLGMKNRQAIIEGPSSLNGEGGPEPFDQSILQKALEDKLWDISEGEILSVSRIIQKESRDRMKSYKELSEFIAYQRGLSRSTPIGWPALGRATSHFGRRISPFFGRPQFHTGIDIAERAGTPVRATADGTVALARWEGGYGRLVIVDHGYGYSTFYAHNSKILVKSGDKVRRGQIISSMGSTGSTTGSHVHYEIWQNGRAINPWAFMAARTVEEISSRRIRQGRGG